MRRSPIVLPALLILGSAFVMACSGGAAPSGGAAGGGAQDMTVKLSEFKFEGAKPTVTAGSPVKFTITNGGTVEHEFAVMPRGTTDMTKALFMVDTKALQPGKTVTKEFTFPAKGDFEIACHTPGHYEAGMHTNLTVQ